MEEKRINEVTWEKKMQVHLANERTFLSWTRTTISLLALGFVTAKSDVLLNGFGNSSEVDSSIFTSSGTLGIFFVSLGVVVNLVATMRFSHINKELGIDNNVFSITGDYLLSGLIFFIAMILMFFLICH